MLAQESMPKELTDVEIERATRFRVGQLVKIVGREPWVSDWARDACRIVGVQVHSNGVVDYTVMHDHDQITDGFSPDNFEAV